MGIEFEETEFGTRIVGLGKELERRKPSYIASGPSNDEINQLRAELDELKRTHRYYVLEAMKRTGIAHPMTVDAYDELLRTVGLIEKEKK